MLSPKLVKGFIVLAPFGVFFVLLTNYLGWSGSKTVHYTVGDTSPFIQSLLPDARVSKPDNGAVKLLDEPVYFSVFAPPGGWQTASVKLSFHTGDKALLELGVMKDLFAQAYDFKPMANTIVEHLADNGWISKAIFALGDNVNVFLRAELSNVNPQTILDSEVAVYRATLPWTMPRGATTAKKDHTYVLPLQGPHELFTAIGDAEAIKLTVKFHDLNQIAGSDEGAVRIYNQGGEMLAEEVFADDGDVLTDSVVSSERTITIAPDGLPAGVYRIGLSATSDIVFDQFVTKQNFLLVKNSMTLAESDQGIVLNTNAKKLTIEPLSAKGLGSVTFGGTSTSLDEVGSKVVVASLDRSASAIMLHAGSVKITGDGFFALASSPFYSPEPAGFSNFAAAEGQYKVIAAYVPPVSLAGDWRVADASFDLATLAKERGAYKFVLSAPLVKEVGGDVEIHAIAITFKKSPMTLHSFLSSLKSFVKDLIW